MPKRKRRRKQRRTGGFRRALGLFGLVFLIAVGFYAAACNRPGSSPGHSSLTVKEPDHRQPITQPVPNEEHDRTVQIPEPTKEETPAVTPEVTEHPAPPSPAKHVEKPSIPTFKGDFSRGDSSKPEIAITFDAGSSAAPTAEILEVLNKHHVHATFFITGKWAEHNPDTVRRIAAEGNEIGNHTYSHKRLTEMTDAEIAQEFDKTDRMITDLTGKSTKPLARVPYGSRNERVLSSLSADGYQSVYWDVDSWDSVKKGITSREIRERVLEKVRNGSVVLMHCGSAPSADALDSLLDDLEKQGYSQVTVSELMRGRSTN